MAKADADRTLPRMPFAGEFSPGVVKLREVLRIVAESAGDVGEMVERIRALYFTEHAAKRKDPEERVAQQRQLAGNVLIGMQSYKLMSNDALSDVGEELFATADDDELYRLFAVHILRRLPGMDVLAAIRGMQARRETVGLDALNEQLRRMGYYIPTHSSYATKMIGWLRLAGVFPSKRGSYEIDEEVVRSLIGVSVELVDEWSQMPAGHRAFIATLRKMMDGTGSREFPVKRVFDQVELDSGAVLGNEGSRKKAILQPLEDAEWIKVAYKSDGRGGKSGYLEVPDKLAEADFETLTGYSPSAIPAEIRPHLQAPLADVFDNLQSEDKYIKGLALEVLAVRIASDIGLVPTKFRLRGTSTGGAEVDMVAEGAHLHHSRWLFQCKNVKGAVALSDAAKEVGMAVVLKAHVIVLVTTGRFASSVQAFAEEVMLTQPYQMILIDGELLEKYRLRDATPLLRFLHDTAHDVMRLKSQQLQAADDGAE